MDEITEREIVEAAKAIDPGGFCKAHPTWEPAMHLIMRWKWDAMEKAYRALRAARKVRG